MENNNLKNNNQPDISSGPIETPSNSKAKDFILKKTASRLVTILQLYQVKLLELPVSELSKLLPEFIKSLNQSSGKELASILGLSKLVIAKNFTLELAGLLVAKHQEITELLASAIPEYNEDKLNATCRAILEVAMAEFLAEITPKIVIIDEYTSLADSLLGEKEVGFVNSILEQLIKP